MRFVYRFTFLAFVSILFYQCQRELSYIGSGDPGQVLVPSPLKANLQGNVLDESGQPAANVVIKVGSEITTTDAKGYFRINDAPLDKNASVVTAEKAGYFTAYRSFSASSGTNQVVIKLIRKDLGGTVDATNGGEIGLTNGTKISLPANGLVKASDNSKYTGTVNIYVAYIDPTSPDIFEKVPGSFMANDKDGKRVLLSSYGMMAVELESSTGEKLQIKSGNTATITSPIPSVAQASAPATIPLWYVDESTGIWKEEGSATKQGNSYIGNVQHFTYWNCDVPVQTVTLKATFKTAKGEPVVNAAINIKPTSGNYYGSAHGYTDSLGQINGPVPANMNLVLEVVDQCGTAVYSKNIGPYNEGVDLGTINLPSSTPSILTVQGKLTACSGGSLTKGYAIITANNWVRYAKVDASGNFSTNFFLCNASVANVQVFGVDEASQQQGSVVSFPATAPTTNVGTLSACGVSSAQFLNYQIDANSYSITETDSLTAFTTAANNTTTLMTTYIDGMKISTSNYLSFKFDHAAKAAGTYAVTNISTQNFNNLTLVQPFNVTITNFPQAAGEFYEGSFSGKFRDASNATHNVTCSFRVRRNF